MQALCPRPHEHTAVRTDLNAIFVSLELSRSTWVITSLAHRPPPVRRRLCGLHAQRGVNAKALRQAPQSTNTRLAFAASSCTRYDGVAGLVASTML